MKVQAIWNGQVLAESDQTVRMEGNHYFPVNSLNEQFFSESDRHTVCPWKGMASYYDVVVDGEVNKAAAWYYPEPSRLARSIKDHVAFWNGVNVVSVQDKSR
jgi:uncharacterized protein (DUF427 family)